MLVVEERNIGGIVTGYRQAQRGHETLAIFDSNKRVHVLPCDRTVRCDFKDAARCRLADQGISTGDPLRAPSNLAVERVVICPAERPHNSAGGGQDFENAGPAGARQIALVVEQKDMSVW